MRKLSLNLLLIFGSLIIALGIGEGLARIYLYWQEGRLREKRLANELTQIDFADLAAPVQPGSFANRPNATVHWWGLDIRTDALGNRTGIPAPQGARRILFLGDSMVFGLGLPDSGTVPAQLQMLLNSSSPQRPAQVINAGVIGYDFRQSLHHLRRLVPSVLPDLVLIGLAGNDLYPTEDPFGDAFGKPGAPGAGQRISIMQRGLRLVSHSALRVVWKQSRLGAGFSPQRVLNYDPEAAAAKQRGAELADEWISALEAISVPYAFIYFSSAEELDKGGELIYLDLLRERRQPLLDLSFASNLSEEDYFFLRIDGHMFRDMHLNAAGSAAAAEEIARWIRGEGLWEEPNQSHPKP